MTVEWVLNPGAALGYLVDQIVGEPPAAVHPVAAYGRYADVLERRTYRDQRSAGVGFVALAVAPPVALGFVLRCVTGATAAAATVGAVSIASRMLATEALAIADDLEHGDLDRARDRVVGLVGRNMATADYGEISRAVVESVAENTVDAVTASMFWGVVAGAPGVLMHRAVNTLDAMVGHRSTHYRNFGWAAARLDDALNYVPARLTALAVVVVSPKRRRAVVSTVVRDAGTHPSPNAGIVEAAFAASLGLRLGGVNRYGTRIERRPHLGDGRDPAPADIAPTVALAQRVDRLFASSIAVVAVATYLRRGVRTSRWPFARARTTRRPVRAADRRSTP
ncbi:MAG: adenosylcobinamide-phosphate synthase CbiB [Actinomycetota bacterium]